MGRFLFSLAVILTFESAKSFRPIIYNCQLSTVNCQPGILNRPEFYKAMQSNSRSLIDAQINLLQTDPGGKYEAFEGALSMKKAGFIGAAHTKIHLFRDGHKMLESAIRKDTANAEYRFLRLMIQEHAPPFLGYNKDIQKDSEYIRKMYKSLPEDLQQAIVRYNKKSKNLKLDLS